MKIFYRLLVSAIFGIVSGLQAFSATYTTLPALQIDSIISANFANPDFYIIDVRTATEFASGHIANAYNIDYRGSSFSSIVDTLDRSAIYVVHCQSGGRSAGAVQVFKDKAFGTVYELQGGMNQWAYPKTTSEQRQKFRYVTADNAHKLVNTGALSLFDCASQTAYNRFNITGSALLPHELSACQDSLATVDKSQPILLYSSDSTMIDSLFLYLFQNGFAEVYTLADVQGWIDADYAYNTDKKDSPVVEPEPEFPTDLDMEPTDIQIYVSEEGLYIQNETGHMVSIYSYSGILLANISSSGSVFLDAGTRSVIIVSDNSCLRLVR